jgi:GWxTD domain-containing protein
LAGVAFLTSCHLYRLERKLDPANAEFLSKVNWIITSQERKVFLELPDAEKPAFIEEFWRRRAPYPDSEENEFKVEYEKRVEEAARLFVHENKPGWLTDRGRILILFGPPDDRLTYPSGEGPGTTCYEEWLYGNFPVVFIDRHCDGDYRLETNDLTSLRSINLMYMHELNRAQDQALASAVPSEKLFDFIALPHVTRRTSSQLAGFVLLRLSIRQLAFRAEGDVYRCLLDVKLELRDEQDHVVWESLSSPELVLKTSDLNRGKQGLLQSLQLPFEVSGQDKVSRLTPGKSFLQVTLTIRESGQTLQKKLELR